MKRTVNVGNVKIGGENKISIQSMTNTDTLDINATLSQINKLRQAGCDIVRIAVSNFEEVKSAKNIIKKSDLPLVADIQNDYRLAVACADIGFNKIRFNPGNIGNSVKIAELVSACKTNGLPIRIGVNSGSVEKDILDKFGNTADALVESALRSVKILESAGFYDTVISVKSSNVKITIDAYRKLDSLTDYPLHLGVTESGSFLPGLTKSAIGIGSLLTDGIGDTIRVSITGDPVKEIEAAKLILRAAGKDKSYCEVVSCPTCSRCKYDLETLVSEVTKLTQNITVPLKIAVMGCPVNGPGEAADADFGVCGSPSGAVLFKKGKVFKKVDMSQVLSELTLLIKEFTDK